MGNLKLKGKDILKLGYPNNQSVNVALEVMKRNFATKNIHHVKSLLKEILVHPENFEKDLTFGQIAESLLSSKKTEKRMLNTQRASFQIFGSNISEEAKNQLYTALKLPVSVQGALMPDAHSGYVLSSDRGSSCRGKCSDSLRSWDGYRMQDEPQYFGYTGFIS